MRLVAAGLGVIALVYLLDRNRLFFLGYDVVRIGGLILLAAFSIWGFVLSRGKEVKLILVGVMMGAFVAGMTWKIESLQTSESKRFYLLSLQVKEGMTLNEAKELLKDYRTYSNEPGYITFTFLSDPQTQDALVIRYDTETMKITSARFSPD